MMYAVVVLLICSALSPFVQFMNGVGLPFALHGNFTGSPSSTFIVALDRLVILGGTKK